MLKAFASLLVCLSAGWSFAQEPQIVLHGAGATFPAPLYAVWFQQLSRQMAPIEYESVGSGSGIKHFLAHEVDFGATDSFLSDKEMQASSQPILHLPTCLGAVAVVYNLPGNPQLNLTQDVVADIFLGRIGKWSDPRIAQANPGIEMPNLKITIVHRSDDSGTNRIFTGYLSRVSSSWHDKVGEGLSVQWPLGLGAEGNPGVVQFIQRIPGSVGYAEMTYVAKSNLPLAALRNHSGRFVLPSPASVSAAANVEIPDDTRVYILDSPAPDGYPISAFSYLIFYQQQNYGGRSRERAVDLAKMLWWIIHTGQNQCIAQSYAPLPPKAVAKAEKIIQSIVYDKEPVLPSSALKDH